MVKARIAVFWVVVALVGTSAAEVYRSVDEHGNPVFTGKPQPGSEKIEVQSTNIQSLPPARSVPIKSPPIQNATNRYQALNILSPANDATLRNTMELVVKVSVFPVLLGQHSLVFLDNGKPLGEPSKNLSMLVRGPHRGAHLLQVRVVDAQGKTLITSETVTVHVHRTSALRSGSP